MKKDFDLLIIGGGSAELTAGWFARQLDLSVAIVEKGRLGGLHLDWRHSPQDIAQSRQVRPYHQRRRSFRRYRS